MEKSRYEIAKTSPIGTELICPGCGQTFIKETYQQTFCKKRTGTQCKDAYWNKVRERLPRVESPSLKTHTFYIGRTAQGVRIEDPKEITIKEIVSILKDEPDFWKSIIPLLEYAFNSGYASKR